MALSAGQVESVQLYSGIESQVVEVQEAGSLSANVWYKGDIVKFNGSGLIGAVASNGAIAGIADSTCTGTDYEKFDLSLLDPAAIYVVRMEDGEESARAYIGNKYGFGLFYTAGAQRIDLSQTTSVDVYIVGIHPADIGTASAGVNEGRVLVRFTYGSFTGV